MNKILVLGIATSLAFHFFLILIFGKIIKPNQNLITSELKSVITIIISENDKDLKNVKHEKLQSTPPMNSPSNSDDKDNDEYLARVRAVIADSKYKNPLARQLNLKGEVELKFSLIYPGEIKNLEVIKRSGHDPLDDSAIATITEAKYNKIPTMPEHMKGLEELVVKVKIIYN